ncbi:hypothetical protein SAMN05428958_10631 [Pantoea sesami]|nr:hypothetical protein SAMN05428958_10631 [Pantoea sesami]
MFSFFSDIFNSFKQSSIERVRSPVLGAFVFSWFGFNWQILVILFMSKGDVYKKIDYINTHFSITELLIGPLFVTALICVLLPLANMLVAAVQRKNNLKFSTISLQAKIALASEQLQIAESEAKKKLAEEKERLYLEKNVHAIIESNDALEKEVHSKNEDINNLNAELQGMKLEVARNVENLRNFEKINEQLNSDKNALTKGLSDSESKFLLQSRSLEDAQRELIRLNEEMSLERADNRDIQKKLILLESKHMELSNDYRFARGDVIRYKDTIKNALEKMSDNHLYALRQLTELASEMEHKWGTIEDIHKEMLNLTNEKNM